MVLVVEREDYAEEPASIMKIVVWNGATRNANEDGSSMTDICSVLDVAMVEYIHTTNEVVIDGVRVEYPNSEDLVTVTPLILFTIENQAREIEENTRQEFYVYEALLG